MEKKHEHEYIEVGKVYGVAYDDLVLKCRHCGKAPPIPVSLAKEQKTEVPRIPPQCSATGGQHIWWTHTSIQRNEGDTNDQYCTN